MRQKVKSAIATFLVAVMVFINVAPVFASQNTPLLENRDFFQLQTNEMYTHSLQKDDFKNWYAFDSTQINDCEVSLENSDEQNGLEIEIYAEGQTLVRSEICKAKEQVTFSFQANAGNKGYFCVFSRSSDEIKYNLTVKQKTPVNDDENILQKAVPINIGQFRLANFSSQETTTWFTFTTPSQLQQESTFYLYTNKTGVDLTQLELVDESKNVVSSVQLVAQQGEQQVVRYELQENTNYYIKAVASSSNNNSLTVGVTQGLIDISNKKEAAKTLEQNVFIKEQIEYFLDEDWYEIQTNMQSFLSLNLDYSFQNKNNETASGLGFLYNEQGQLVKKIELSKEETKQLLMIQLEQNKKYYLKVQAPNALGSYQVNYTVHNNPGKDINSAFIVDYDVTYYGFIEPAITQYYKIKNVAQDTKTTINITANESSKLVVYDEFNKIIKEENLDIQQTNAKTVEFEAKANTGYYFAVIGNEENEQTSNYSVRVSQTHKLDKPENITVSRKESQKAILSWNPVFGATDYLVYISKEEKGNFTLLGETNAPNQTYEVKELDLDTTYYFLIKAKKQVEEKTYFSDASDIYSAPDPVIRITAPTQVKAEKLTGYKAQVNWSGVTGVTGYQIYYSTTAQGDFKLSQIVLATQTTAQVAGLEKGKGYYFKVKAFKEMNGQTYFSEFSQTVFAKEITVQTPEHVTAKRLSGYKAQVNWEGVSGVTHYRVLFSFTPDGIYQLAKTVPANETTTQVTGLDIQKTYYFKIIAVKEIEGEQYLSPLSKSAFADLFFVMVPGNLQGVRNSGYRATLSWEKKQEVTGYEIYVLNMYTGQYSLIKRTGNVTDVEITNLVKQRDYYFKVRAYIEVDGERYYSEFTQTVLVMEIDVYYPKMVQAQKETGYRAKVQWEQVTGADGYEVHYSLTQDGPYTQIAHVNAPSVSALVHGLQKGQGYYFKVRAFREIEGEYYYSYFSIPVYADKIQVETPKSLQAQKETGYRASISWYNTTNYVAYEIQYATDIHFSDMQVAIAFGPTTATQIHGLIKGESYYFRVRAIHKIEEENYYSEFSQVAFAQKISLEMPQTVTAKKISSTIAELDWELDDDVTGYEIYYAYAQNGSFEYAQEAFVNFPTYVYNLTSGQDYYFKVRAFKQIEGEKYYSGFSAVKAARDKVVNVPTNVNVKRSSSKVATISWQPVNDAQGYYVNYYSSKVNISYYVGKGTSLEVKSLEPDRDYRFSVCAMKNIDGYYYFSADSYKYLVKDPYGVGVPSTVKGKKSSYTKAYISWSKVSYATGYRVYYSTSKTSGYKTAAVVSASKSSVTVSNLTKGKTYYFAVRAYRVKDGITHLSPTYTPIVVMDSYRITVSKPTSVKVRKTASSQLTVSWSKSSTANMYKIYYSTSKYGTYYTLKDVNAKYSSYSFTNLKKKKTYYFYVRSYRYVSGYWYRSSGTSPVSIYYS